MIASYVGFANSENIFRARRNIREAKRTKTVTLLGLVFTPLAQASNLFSIKESFLSGDEHFRVYFVIRISFITMVLFGYYVLD
jgi:hypothetical protein